MKFLKKTKGSCQRCRLFDFLKNLITGMGFEGSDLDFERRYFVLLLSMITSQIYQLIILSKGRHNLPTNFSNLSRKTLFIKKVRNSVCDQRFLTDHSEYEL